MLVPLTILKTYQPERKPTTHSNNNNNNNSMTQFPIHNDSKIHLPKEYTPSQVDIVCGRGLAFSRLPGNEKVFMATIRANLPRYSAGTTRLKKSAIVASVIDEILETGARFIKYDTKSKQFYELNAEQIHEKTGHAIRDLLKKIKKQQDPPIYNKGKVSVAKKRQKRRTISIRPGHLDTLVEEDFLSTDEIVAQALKVSDELSAQPNMVEAFLSESCFDTLFDDENDQLMPEQIPSRPMSFPSPHIALPRQISYETDELRSASSVRTEEQQYQNSMPTINLFKEYEIASNCPNSNAFDFFSIDDMPDIDGEYVLDILSGC